MKAAWTFVGALVTGVLASLVLTTGALANENPNGAVTFAKDVLPIFQAEL